MKRRAIQLFFFLFLLSTAFSCLRWKKGTLERMEYWPGTGSAYYSAKPLGDDYSGPESVIYPDSKNSSNSLVHYYYYFWEDESPKSLGYTDGPHTDADGKEMFYHKDGYRTPGRNGIWKNGPQFGSGGGGSGSCSGGYKSPTTDAQLDAYCGAAYAYRCLDGKSLNDPSVQAVCSYYNDLKTSSAPSCPYCK